VVKKSVFYAASKFIDLVQKNVPEKRYSKKQKGTSAKSEKFKFAYFFAYNFIPKHF
jgi:hypothetical protein